MFGAVVTHGTDTLEETVYLLDLLHAGDKPVCVTGAMPSGTDVSYDGTVNLLDAVRVAAAPEARGKGVLVVLNDEIHAAREVTKTHSANVKTSSRLSGGRSAMWTPNRIVFRREQLGRQSLRPISWRTCTS